VSEAIAGCKKNQGKPSAGFVGLVSRQPAPPSAVAMPAGMCFSDAECPFCAHGGHSGRPLGISKAVGHDPHPSSQRFEVTADSLGC